MKVVCPHCDAKTEGLYKNPNICGRCKRYIPPGGSDERANEALNALKTRRNKPEVSLAPHVPKLSISIPQPAPRKIGQSITALEWGDTHFPFQDDQVLSVIQAIAEDEQPDFLIHKGDGLDCRLLSRFDKDPARKENQQDEIDQLRIHLATMRKTCPNSRFVYLEGNHEDRLRRTLWNLEGPAAVLSSLRVVQKAMTWPVLLGLDELRIEFVPYGEQSKRDILPKFITKHGSLVRKSAGATAIAEQAKYNKSGSSGHTHRLAVVHHRDANGAHVWVETGCTCRLDPDYCQDPDWQNGCVFYTFDKETGAVTPEPVEIRNGLGVFRGRTYGKRAA